MEHFKISYGTAMMTSLMIDCVSRSQQQVETKRKLWKQEYEKSLRWELWAQRETLIREMVRGMHKCVLFWLQPKNIGTNAVLEFRPAHDPVTSWPWPCDQLATVKRRRFHWCQKQITGVDFMSWLEAENQRLRHKNEHLPAEATSGSPSILVVRI